MRVHPAIILLQVSTKRSDGSVSLKQEVLLIVNRSSLLRRSEVETSVRKQSLEVNELIPFLFCLMLKTMTALNSNNLVYGLRDERPTVEKFSYHKEHLLLDFSMLPDYSFKASNIF